MRTKILCIFIAAATLFLLACKDILQIEPLDRVSASQLFSDINGIKTALSTLYNKCPIEDFNWDPDYGPLLGTDRNSEGGWQFGTHTDEIVIYHSNTSAVPGPVGDGYWDYTGIRYTNNFFATIKSLKGGVLDAATYDRLASEAHFIRAYMYFTLVKRYGGVPIIKELQQLGGDNSQLYVPRSTEKETWDFVLAECDSAIANLPSSVTSVDGTYTAYVLKMLGKNETAMMWEVSAVKAIEWAEVEYQKWLAGPDFAKVRDRAKRAVPVERNLAAIELYRLTKDKRWHEVFLSTQKDIRDDAAFIYARLDKTLADKKTQQSVTDTLMAQANRLVKLSENNAFGLTTGSPGRAIGGWSSSYTMPASPILVRAHYLSWNQRYLKTILRSALYSAGANPMNVVMTTGLGENCVKNPLHEDSRHTGQPAPIGTTVSGPEEIPVGAPAGSDVGKRLDTECMPAGSKWPSAESYFDLYGWAEMNEYVIDRPLGQTAYIWGYLASRKKQ